MSLFGIDIVEEISALTYKTVISVTLIIVKSSIDIEGIGNLKSSACNIS